jgi:hypothetical protein
MDFSSAGYRAGGVKLPSAIAARRLIPVRIAGRATAAQTIHVGQSQRTRLHILWGNTLHDTSHYGNLVTYLRIKGVVPPSTEGQ